MTSWFYCLEPVAACYITAEWVVEKSQFRYEMGKGQGPQQLENLPVGSIS